MIEWAKKPYHATIPLRRIMKNLPLPVEVHDYAEGGAGGQDDYDETDKTHDRLGPHPVRTHAVVDREGHH
jgi:hypothetical protein